MSGARCLCNASSARELFVDSSISLLGALVTAFFLEEDKFVAEGFCLEAGLVTDKDWEAVNGCCFGIVDAAVEIFEAVFVVDEVFAASAAFAIPERLPFPMTRALSGFLSTVTLSFPPSVTAVFI